MIGDAYDELPCRTGYVLTLVTGERIHVWPETGLVVSELAGEPLAAGVSSTATVPLTGDSSALLARVWAGVLARWRRTQ